ncbi:hypothetical protein FZI91_07665 [Mycobacterium sp. CBMA271]|uniref:hypothetical protein n=1 Tax=unclassified Mycobacteroides TaxID=2618759 RepID=UPI00132267C2|nr:MULTISPECIES: hypothetical protein [unclassified Mycobacteroides]MUM19169.1 hypothetical protein [Mycobacteroides sp. CBMA 326]MUM21583.1 hypothetical protein [Mycobacteroides sp. CBMA 271]
MRRVLAAVVGVCALLTPGKAAADPYDCASVDRARVQIRGLSLENGVAVRQTAIARNRAIATLLRTAAEDTSDVTVQERALDASGAAQRYADVMAAQTSVDGVLAPPGEEMARAVNTMAALDRVCPAR